MGLGSYVICEWCSIQETYPQFENALRKLEAEINTKVTSEWSPRRLGYLKAAEGQAVRTTILPALFDDHASLPMNAASRTLALGGATWRQLFTTAGHQQLLAGVGASNTIPEDFKIAWMGLAFPNKEQHITEIRWQYGDQKFGRINLEQLALYKKPALVFEEGMILDEETSFELYGFVRGPIPTDMSGLAGLYQYIIPLGAAYAKQIDRVLGNTGAAIT